MKTARGVTLIVNGQLVDGTGAAAVPDAAVVVRDGRIAYAGPALVPRLKRELAGLLRGAGYRSMADAVGVDA